MARAPPWKAWATGCGSVLRLPRMWMQKRPLWGDALCRFLRRRPATPYGKAELGSQRADVLWWHGSQDGAKAALTLGIGSSCFFFQELPGVATFSIFPSQPMVSVYKGLFNTWCEHKTCPVLHDFPHTHTPALLEAAFSRGSPFKKCFFHFCRMGC